VITASPSVELPVDKTDLTSFSLPQQVRLQYCHSLFTLLRIKNFNTEAKIQLNGVCIGMSC